MLGFGWKRYDCRVVLSSARRDGDSSLVPDAPRDRGYFQQALRGEAFPKKQLWPRLDRVIAEAGEQLMDSDVFNTRMIVTSAKNDVPGLGTAGQGWSCPGPARSRAEQSGLRSLSSFSSGSLACDGGLLGQLRPEPVPRDACPHGSPLGTAVSPRHRLPARAGVLGWLGGG